MNNLETFPSNNKYFDTDNREEKHFEKFYGRSQQSDEITFTLTTNESNNESKLKAFSRAIELNQREKDFCIVAIKNLLKKNRYSELSLDLAEEVITEEEFDQEIDRNPQKYTIDINYLESKMEAKIIANIVSKISENLTVDEVSEIFSVDSDDLEKKLSNLSKLDY